MLPAMMLPILLLLGQAGPEPGDTVVESIDATLAREIGEKGFKRVAVFPVMLEKGENGEDLIVRRGQADTSVEETATDSLLGSQLCELLAESLSKQDRFRVVEHRRTSLAMREVGFRVGDIRSVEKLQVLSGKLEGIDALIVMALADRHYPPKPGQVVGKIQSTTISCEIVSITDAVAIDSTATETVPATTAINVYRGGDATAYEFAMAGFGVADATGAGAGVLEELRGLNGSIHYLERADAKLVPRIIVADKERPLQFLTEVGTGRRQCWVAIEPSEEFIVGLRKKDERELYLALTLDGLNSLSRTRDFQKNVWFLRAGGRSYFVDGWTVKRADGEYDLQKFLVVPAQESLAYTRGEEGEELMGQMSFIYYATEGDPYLKRYPGAGGKSWVGSHSLIGMAFGLNVTAHITEYPNAPKRSIHSVGYTIHYAPESVLKQRLSVARVDGP